MSPSISAYHNDIDKMGVALSVPCPGNEPTDIGPRSQSRSGKTGAVGT